VRKLINLNIKKATISKRESGKSVGHLIAEYGIAKSTIGAILKQQNKWLCWMVTLL